MSKKDQIVLGVKITSHDTGAALVAEGRIVAIAEERLCRVKHSTNIFPALSIKYCMDTLRVSPKDIDLIVIDQVGKRDISRMAEIFKDKTGNTFEGVPIEVINHHDAHAAAAFYSSPFDDAAVLVIDGAGEKIKTNLGISATETETMYRGTGNLITQLQKTTHIRHMTVFPYTFGIAKLYTLFCEAIINLGHYNEGKMMGLAPYGTDSLLKQFPFEKWFVEKDGHMLCNPKIEFLGKDKFLKKKKLEKYWRQILINILQNNLVSHFVRLLFPHAFIEDPKIFEPVRLPLKARTDEQLPDKVYSDAAYLVQKVLEEVVTLWGRKIKAITSARNLCVAGGVGLNIDANMRFLNDVGFEHLFVQPASTDTGIPLGNALWGYHMILKKPRFWRMKNASLGRKYGEKEILHAIDKKKHEINFHRTNDAAKEAARLVAKGNIIGWFHGGSEYGPRSLGNRSILCDAGRKDMKDILNNKVKHREPWRPFATSILAEHQSEWFELDERSPFMLLDAPVREEKKKLIPSIVHVDGTCRIQAVTKESNARYYDLLQEFKKITGVPLVLNTSFNLGGDPIVETPNDALQTFLKTKMDYLILEDYIVEKK